MSPSRLPTRLGSALLVGITLAALSIDMGDIHSRHMADSFVPVLESIFDWEPYYWQQNRYGMLVALLAKPWSHPFTNLLVQNGITIWCGLASVLLAARYLFRDQHWTASGLPAAAAYIAVAPLQFQWIFSSTFNVFSTSLALGFTGLVCLERLTWARAAAGIVCFAVAAWVNSAIGVLLLPLTTLVGASRLVFLKLNDDERTRQKRDLCVQSAACTAATVLALGFQSLAPAGYHNTAIYAPPLNTWWPLVRDMTAVFLAETHPGIWLSFLTVCLVYVLVRSLRRFGGRRDHAATVVATALASAAYILAMGILFEGRWRYAAPALVLLHTAVVTAAIRPLFKRPPPLWIAAILLPALVPIQHGLPSLARVERDLRARLDVGFTDVVEARATHVAGDYWRVWPIVFAANWSACELGRDEPIWGVSHRSMPTERLWKAVPPERTRVAVLDDDPLAAYYLSFVSEKWGPAEKAGKLRIYSPK